MNHTLSEKPSVKRRAPRPEPRSSSAGRRIGARRPQANARERQPLARYTDRCGRSREIIARATFAGTLLVVDLELATGGDPRLIAHLAADEPVENAALVCRTYLEDLNDRHCLCRRLIDEDAGPVLGGEGEPQPTAPSNWFEQERRLVDRLARSYALEPVGTAMSIPELRWCCRGARSSTDEAAPMSARQVVARLESYEPVRELTTGVLALHRDDSALSTTVLRAELARLQESPIVLNRRLREVVLATIERDELSMSEIAIRCGRVKHDRRGNQSGETSWLARRIGLLPEGGQSTPTPWIHSDVLALIARRGLAISPREVEVA
jgi:hypothetical protein